MKKVLILVFLSFVIAFVGCNKTVVDFSLNSTFSLKSVVLKIDTSLTATPYLADTVYVNWAIEEPTQGEGLAIFKSTDSTNFPVTPESSYIYGRINSYTDVDNVMPGDDYFYRLTLPTSSDTAVVYTLETKLRDTIKVLSPVPTVDTAFQADTTTGDTIMPNALTIQFKASGDVETYSVDIGYIDTTTNQYKPIWMRLGMKCFDSTSSFPDTVPFDTTAMGKDDVIYSVDSSTNYLH
ncbi:MAG: hypothetical protein GWP03_05080 [Proteobacteria bacterium]|nr:hypothetical protein [Pseudomonadota bacterium]